MEADVSKAKLLMTSKELCLPIGTKRERSVATSHTHFPGMKKPACSLVKISLKLNCNH
jgi:hypothetical protein